MCQAFETIGCGSGYKCGIPGETIKQTTSCHDESLLRSRTTKSSASAAILDFSLSSQTIGTAPPAHNALAAVKPDRPSPKTATLHPLYPRTGIINVTLM